MHFTEVSSVLQVITPGMSKAHAAEHYRIFKKKSYTYTPSTDNICILITATYIETIKEYRSTKEKGWGLSLW
jgi:hypothetical protein